MTNYEKLIATLKEVFMLDKAELDFGIYRIMNHKRKDIEEFLEKDLVPQVRQVLAENLSIDKQALQKDLESAIKQAQELGADPDTLPKVQQLKARLGEAGDMDGLENEVFSLLANFFKRYFDKGDFISMRRYKKDVYSIPYEGEEVKLHWANADQYYIKTSEYFKNYRFKLSNGKTVAFELVEASTEQNNNKVQGDKERLFALYTEKACESIDDEFKIYFTYEPADKKVKQNDLLQQAFDAIKTQIPKEFTDLLSLKPTEKDKQRTLLQKHLLDYTARNTFDYFIHKDLDGFLTRELDFYIKNEVLFIDDLNTRDEQEFLKQLSKIKAIKKIGEKIIIFLAQLENFQKKLWLKKKMVVECNHCITLDRVPKDLYTEILNNQAQIQEWINLFAIDEIKVQEAGGLFSENKVGFSNPLTLNFLNQNPFLVLDTAFFTETFKSKLIGSIENFDEQCDGLMINSENFQALNLLQEKFNHKIDVIYGDPPYNAKSSEIIYKNSFKHSSWISFMFDRVNLSACLKTKKGAIITAIDENEAFNLMKLFDSMFPEWNKTVVTVLHNPAGVQGDNFSYSHEYAVFMFEKGKNIVGKTTLEKKSTEPFRDWGPSGTRNPMGNTFYPIYVDLNGDNIIGFGEACKQDFHPILQNVIKENYIEVYPIGDEGDERKWVFARDTVDEIAEELFVSNNNGVFQIMRAKSKGSYKTVWNDSLYYANIYGSKLLNNIIGDKKFDFPKSVYTVRDCIFSIHQVQKGNCYILDYFAGSGTTGHAVINLNRVDNGKRKFILIEMGAYFDTVTKPRIQKVIYSKDWKNGKPLSREGISHCFKYMRLESYEDTLNNLTLKQNEIQQQSLAMNPAFKEGYMLNYALDVETQDSLLNLEWFINPFNCYLNITRNNELQPTKVDLVETFNYLIGLVVESYAVPKEGYVVVTGKNLAGDSILVVWRDCTTHDSPALNAFLEKSKYNPLDNEFDRIYVNGDNNVENLKVGDERWKVMLIEEEFKKRMFEN